MGVLGLKTVAMVNDNQIAVTAGKFGARNFPLGLDVDFIAGAAG